MSGPARDRLLGALAAAGAGFLWGTLGPLAKLLYAEGVSFEALVAFRAVVGWSLVFGFVLGSGRAKELRVGSRDLLFLLPLGFVGIGVFYLFYYYTLREGSVGVSAILLYSAPAFVAVLARLFLKETLGAFKVTALILTVCGISLVAGVYDPSDLAVRPVVLLTGLLAGFSYGLYAIFGRSLTARLGSAVILTYALGFGAALLTVAAVPTLDTLSGLPPGYYAILLMLGVVHTLLAYTLYTFGLKKLGAGRAAIVASIEPVVAGAIGVILLNEALTAAKLAGAMLVISGAILAQLGGRKPTLRDDPAATSHPR